MNQLVKFEYLKEDQAIAVFTKENGLDPYLQEIQKELESFVPDTSTATGRKAIATMAAKVSRSKTFLDNAGKTLVSKLKEQPKLIDAERRRVREWCDAKRDETRKPLTDWENAEKARVDALELRLSAITSYQDMEFTTAEACKEHLDSIHAITVDESFGEVQEQAETQKELAISRLSKTLATLMQLEAAEKLAEEKRIEAERIEREQREKAIAVEAEQRAKREAEQEAERVRAESEAKAKRAREESERKEREAREASERRELELKLAAETAEREKIEAEQRARQAEVDARLKLEAEDRAEQEAAAAREANKKHKAKINNEVLSALVAIGANEATAKSIVKAIAKGQVPNVQLFY